MLVKDIYNAIDELAPFDTVMPHDNVGLLVGDFEAEVTGCVVSLDCTMETLRFAREKNAKLIVTHHPVIFEPLKELCSDSLVYALIREGMSVICAHTNLDLSSGGVNKLLCDRLQINNTHVFENKDRIGFIGELSEELSADDFAKSMKQKLFADSVRYVDCGRKIKTVAVIGGAGEDYLFDSRVADAYVTGEVPHHIYCYAKNAGIQLFVVGHYHSEAVVLNPLAEYLSKKFGGVHFFVSDVLPFKEVL